MRSSVQNIILNSKTQFYIYRLYSIVIILLQKLNNIEQLLVIDMLLNHFSNSTQPSDDQKKYQLFSALFRAPVDEVRFNFLAKILSVGIVMKHSTIFHLSAAWLQVCILLFSFKMA